MSARARGYAIITGPEGPVEFDTFTCAHCNAVKAIAAYAKPEDVGGLCRCCWGMICPPCRKRDRCDPIEEKCGRVERDQDFRRWFLEALS